MNPYLPLIDKAKGDFRKMLIEAWEKRKLVTLRDYQNEAVGNTLAAFDDSKSALLAMSTGVGKTETMLGIIKAEIERGKLGRVLFIAHREELIYQPLTRIVRGWDLPCPGIMMGNYHIPDKQIVVATVQTLSAVGQKRLKDAIKHGEFTHVITDEAHRSTSKTYVETYQALRGIAPSIRMLGATASPFRADEEDLGKLYDVVTYRLGTLKAIQMGALCHFKAKAPVLNFSLRDVRRTSDGWNEAKVSQLMATINAEKVIVEKWKEEARDRPTIAFTASVEQAERLCEAFKEGGARAAWASGETPREERGGILRKYEAGELEVIINYGIWVEGMDAPRTSCIIMARPTSSPIVYMQAIGRGLRTHPGKKDCLILQFVPADAPIDMMLVGDLLGKPKKQEVEEARAAKDGLLLDEEPTAKKKRLELSEEEVSSLDFFAKALQEERDTSKAGLEADPDTVVMANLNLLNKGPHKQLAWVTERITHIMTLSISPKMSIAIVPPRPERAERAKKLLNHPSWSPTHQREYEIVSRYNLYVINRDPAKNKKSFYRLESSEDLDPVQMKAYEFAEEHGEKWLYKRHSQFRGKPPTDKQIQYARNLGVYKEGMDRGRISQAIDHIVTLNRLRQERVTGEQRK